MAYVVGISYSTCCPSVQIRVPHSHTHEKHNNISMYTAGPVYTSFFLPYLDYCDTVWSCYGSVNADKLEKLQRRAVWGSEKALHFLGYVTLEKRRKSHVHNLVKKCLSNPLSTVLFITRMYCPEEQGTEVNLDSHV